MAARHGVVSKEQQQQQQETRRCREDHTYRSTY